MQSSAVSLLYSRRDSTVEMRRPLNVLQYRFAYFPPMTSASFFLLLSCAVSQPAAALSIITQQKTIDIDCKTYINGTWFYFLQLTHHFLFIYDNIMPLIQ